MTGLCGAIALLKSLLPDEPGGKPPWLYVVLCLVVPAALGIVMTTGIGWLQKLARARRKDRGDV
jgi:hypothetical protein